MKQRPPKNRSGCRIITWYVSSEAGNGSMDGPGVVSAQRGGKESAALRWRWMVGVRLFLQLLPEDNKTDEVGGKQESAVLPQDEHGRG